MRDIRSNFGSRVPHNAGVKYVVEAWSVSRARKDSAVKICGWLRSGQATV